MIRGVVGGASLVIALLLYGASVHAATFNSSNYTINGSLGDTTAGTQSSSNYTMVSTSGESIAGSATGQSYKLGSGYTPTQQDSIEVQTVPRGLIGYYSLDQTSGTTVIDDGPNGANGTYSGNLSWVNGKLNGGLQGFSSTEFVAVDNDATFNVDAITSCFWMNQTATGNNAMVVSRTRGTPDENGMWSMGFNSSNSPRVRMYFDGTYNVLSSSTDVPLGTWVHLCMTYDGADLVMYQDGVEEDRITLNGVMSDFSWPLTFGALSNGSQTFNGTVDEVKIYDYALTEREIGAEYAAQNSGASNGLVLGDSLTPGQPVSAELDTIVHTSAAGYSLALNQNNNLTSGGNEIPAVAGSIASPVVWSNGTTKGLGFTVYNTNATTLPVSWAGGSAYASLPNTPTSFYSRSGYTGGAKDIHNLRLKLDTATSQAVGNYSNQVTITGTITP